MNKSKHCWICGKQFEPTRAWNRYCSIKCKSENWRNTKGRIVDGGRYCRQCGKKFIPPRIGGANMQHCSTECSTKSARESRSKFYKRNPQKYSEYQKKWHSKVGTDNNLLRFYLRYPEAPKKCQSCGESRVLEIAHKPGHKRNGAWRNKENTTIDKVWILCPTCHKLLDRKGYSPKQLNLI
jgi:ribosomal protein L32E